MKLTLSFLLAALLSHTVLVLGSEIARGPPCRGRHCCRGEHRNDASCKPTPPPTHTRACGGSSTSKVTPTPTACPTSYLPCTPTIIMDFVVRNGAFDQPTRIPVGATQSAVPSWTPTRLQNATIDFVGEATGPFNVNSNGAARYKIKGQPPGAFADFAALTQNVAYCHRANYTISFAARQNEVVAQSCRLSFFTTHEGNILTQQLTPTWTEYGPFQWLYYQTFRDNLCEQNADGSFGDELQIQVQCEGVAGQNPKDVEIEIDSIFIVPIF